MVLLELSDTCIANLGTTPSAHAIAAGSIFRSKRTVPKGTPQAPSVHQTLFENDHVRVLARGPIADEPRVPKVLATS